MSLIWKVLLGLTLPLVVAAVAAGVVAASSVEGPAPRDAIVIRDSESRSPAEDQGDDKSHEVKDDDDEDDGIRTARVEPDDLDDARDDLADAREDRIDDRRDVDRRGDDDRSRDDSRDGGGDD